jgi:hypothetical protein
MGTDYFDSEPLREKPLGISIRTIKHKKKSPRETRSEPLKNKVKNSDDF